MENDNMKDLFEKLQGSFDTEEPAGGHQLRFLEKLEADNNVVSIQRKTNSWWKPLSIAASVALLFMVGIGIYNTTSPTINEQIAEISPEVSNSRVYFASLIEDQVKQLESENSPETKKIIDDTMIQLQKLETNYSMLEKDLLNGGNSKGILSAMIINFQTRIDLLQDVMEQIEAIKNLKDYNNEMSQTIL